MANGNNDTGQVHSSNQPGTLNSDASHYDSFRHDIDLLFRGIYLHRNDQPLSEVYLLHLERQNAAHPSSV